MLRKYADAKVESYLLPKELSTILRDLGSSDHITFMVRQSKLSEALSPSVFIMTSKKLIVVNRSLAGLKSHITFIPYSDIANSHISHGMILSSIFLRMKGSALKVPFRSDIQDGEIRGLERDDADLLLAQLNQMLRGEELEEYSAGPDPMAAYATTSGMQAQAQTFHKERVGEGRGFDLLSLYRRTGTSDVKRAPAHMPVLDVMEPAESTGPQIPGEAAKQITADDLLIFKLRKKNTARIYKAVRPLGVLLAKLELGRIHI
ncbi:MAG: PH domain-containing protein [Candidatus Micrarchaeota archaeon]|nr:PH domain-containing protein [Candidatus Micrarchaeota archaeon]MDE1834551.1 PH domain-containing protein [Candidatus Micrarchaeota archaeon]MDE1859781.1 PH domain-containing protein [Candidatus Micrarchaeota archaeon]